MNDLCLSNRVHNFLFSCHVLIITSDMSPYKEEAVIALFTVYRTDYHVGK